MRKFKDNPADLFEKGNRTTRDAKHRYENTPFPGLISKT